MAEISRNQYSAIGEDHWFKTEMLSLDQIVSSPWGRIPHIIMIGMSCQGTIGDFQRRLFEGNQGKLPLQHRCCEADACALAIPRTNTSRLLAHFFAQHEQYPFPLPGGEDETHRVATLLRSCLGEEAEAAFTKARLGAEEFGTGRSTRLFTLEHVFLEFPSIVGRGIKDHGENPSVLGCKLEQPQALSSVPESSIARNTASAWIVTQFWNIELMTLFVHFHELFLPFLLNSAYLYLVSCM